MDDQKLIELYWQRSENAIAETAKKYGNYCYRVAYNILANNEDSEECVNDTYFKVWEDIPPTRPNRFFAFIGKIVRHLAINRYTYLTAEKRGGSQVPLALEELSDCIPDQHTPEKAIEDISIDDVAYIDLPRAGERKTDIAPNESSETQNNPVQAYQDVQGIPAMSKSIPKISLHTLKSMSQNKANV